MLKLVLAAIAWLQPNLAPQAAQTYAEIIAEVSTKHQVDPLLVVAIIQRETKFQSSKVSRTKDYGLMQIHVTHTSSSQFLGREKDLFDPRVNIRRGVYLLSHYRALHKRCKNRKHHYWDHYKFGTRVPRRFKSATDRGTITYKALLRRFAKPLTNV